ncbi:FUSC family protein [Kitasatospora sp. NPDC088346]|uniref:FUSC family protein n=1 Tax=Kitasatospora sp. NPDC088346 TaxID=3364073 RepID=UPI0038214474
MSSDPDTGGPAVRAPRRPVAFLRTGTGPGPEAARRAVRVTVSACAGFYLCLYGLGQPVTGTYALFAAVALAGLSRIPGTGRQRAAVLVRVLPAGWVLVTIGTLLAVRTWSAVLGTLVIGFVLAFGAVAGPRIAGAAPGLQLLYILPCFPPYEPHTLDERLGGVTLGVVLLIAAEAFLLPDPPNPSYRDLAAGAARCAQRCAGELSDPPWRISAGSRAAAEAAGVALRPSLVPPAERQAGPGVRERALADAGGGARVLLARLRELPEPAGHRPATTDPGTELLAAVATAAGLAASALRSWHPAPATALEAALARFRERRAAWAATADDGLAGALGRQAALLEVADAALFTLRAVDVAIRGREAPPGAPGGAFWYAGKSAAALWWKRVAGHLSPHSVHFQNAVRISLGLAAARTVAGVASLPHGFWAMLAALTLTRTTAVQTRDGVRRALTGTLLGAATAAVLLTAVGHHTNVYAVALPVVMLATFSLGPLLGLGWAQGLFTLVVSMVFAQLAPAGWRLAEARVLDVLVGSLIGLVIGVLAWPRGAHEELRRDVAVLLRTVAGTVTSTTAAVAAGRRQPDDGNPALLHALIMAESTYTQYQSEPPGAAPGATDWQAALIAGHHALRGSRRLLDLHELPVGRPPRSDAGAWLVRRGDRVAHRYLRAGEVLGSAAGPGAPPPGPGGPGLPPGLTDGAVPPAALPALFDTDAWLRGLAADLARITPAPVPAASRPGSPGPSSHVGPPGH